MKLTYKKTILAALLITGAAFYTQFNLTPKAEAQQPTPAPAADAPAIDLTGYWTPPMHED